MAKHFNNLFPKTKKQKEKKNTIENYKMYIKYICKTRQIEFDFKYIK